MKQKQHPFDKPSQEWINAVSQQPDKQYFEAVPISELPDGEKRVFTILTDDYLSMDKPHYIKTHPDKFKAFLRPVNLSDLIKEEAGKAFRKGANTVREMYEDSGKYLLYGTDTLKEETEYLKSL